MISKTPKIGIIGGMGPVATAELYERLLQVSQEEFDAIQDYEYPEVFIDSVSFEGSDESGIVEEEAVLEQFLNALDNLEYSDSDVVIVPCNTLHSFSENLQHNAEAEVLDMVSETVSRVESDGLEKVGLLASETSYEKNIYEERTENVDFLTPNEGQRESLSNIILNIMGGKKLDEDIAKLREIADSLEERGAEAIILGCTELPVIVDTEDFSQKTYDTIQILAEVSLLSDF